MRRLLAGLLAAALLAGCGAPGSPGGGDDPVEESNPESTLDETSQEESLPQEPPETEPSPPPQGTLNAALTRVEGLESLPEDCVVGIKHYGGEMGWAEANAILNLERSAVEPGDYFLIVPRFAGSSVVVEPLVFRDGALAPEEPGYRLESCPDDYALIVNSTMPEASPTLQVTVSYGGVSGVYRFSYDGRGDAVYPVVRDGCFLIQQGAPEPEYRVVSGVLAASAYLGHVDQGVWAHFTGELPTGWEDLGYRNESYFLRDGILTVSLWGFLDTPDNYHSVEWVLTARGEMVELTTPGGRTLCRAANTLGNLAYAFEWEEGLVMVVELEMPGGGTADRTEQLDAVMGRFLDSLEVEQVVTESFQDPFDRG